MTSLESSERLEFANVVEGLFLRGLEGAVDDALTQKLKVAGIDLSQPLLPAYPARVVARGIETAAAHLFPQLSREQAINQLGHAFFRGYTATLLGSAMLQVMKLIGPRRTLERMQRNFRTGGNYIVTRFVEKGPRHVELWFNEVNGMPTYYQGIIEEGGHQIGTTAMTVEYRDDPDGGTWFLVNWSE